MKIYIAHAKNSDFQKELYDPIKEGAFFARHTFIFPHEGDPVDSKRVISECDLILAEVSLPSTGLGIELGWASDMGKKIVCIYKLGIKPSRSLNVVCQLFVSYRSRGELISSIAKIIVDCE